MIFIKTKGDHSLYLCPELCLENTVMSLRDLRVECLWRVCPSSPAVFLTISFWICYMLREINWIICKKSLLSLTLHYVKNRTNSKMWKWKRIQIITFFYLCVWIFFDSLPSLISNSSWISLSGKFLVNLKMLGLGER